MNKNPKVLHVISGLTVGGAEMMLYKLLNTARSSGMGVVSLSAGGELAPDIRALGVPLWEVPMPGGVPRAGFRRQFRAVLEEFQPDLVASWMYRANAVCSAMVPAPIPVVWHVRQSLDHNSSQRLLFRFTRRVNRWILRGSAHSRLLNPARHPSLVIYNSRSSREQHRAAGFLVPEGRDLVIPNGFDTERFRPDAAARTAVRQEWGVPEEAVVFGIVGRHHRIKDHYNYLRAAEYLVRKRLHGQPQPGRPVRFVMVGRGLDGRNEALLADITARGLQEQTLLLGEQRNLPALYSGFDFQVSSSLVEAFPNVLGEAMACALPCIATAVGDSAWVVDETGLTVPAGDSAALGAAMVRALDWSREERLRRGAAARERVLARFGIEAVTGEFLRAYQSVAGSQE